MGHRSLDVLQQLPRLSDQRLHLFPLFDRAPRKQAMLERVSVPFGAPDPGTPPCIRQPTEGNVRLWRQADHGKSSNRWLRKTTPDAPAALPTKTGLPKIAKETARFVAGMI